MPEIALSMENISKVYPNGVIANKDVNFSVNKGEIHALVGENGAGKSTLMKILFGIEHPTGGDIIIKGTSVKIRNPLDAISHGLGMVHQHFMLVESMTVSENINLGSEPVKGALLDKNAAKRRAREIIDKYRFRIDADSRIRDLPIGTRQKVEILKALFKGADILILDEPTAVLTPQETEELFVQLKSLKDSGHTIIFISHKLNEIKEICDRLTVMRNGSSVGVYDVASVTQEEISNLMVGKNMDWSIAKSRVEPGEKALEVSHVNIADVLGKTVVSDISFSLRSKSIIGVVGVEGNGQNELVEAIAGIRKPDSGSIRIFGSEAVGKSVRSIRECGLAHIPQDRIGQGVAVESSVEENLFAAFTDDKRFAKGAFLKKKEIASWADALIREYQIKTDSRRVPVKMLSGGNMQKVVVAREVSGNAKCIIANQPTRGIDVGAAKFIHEKLIALRDGGAAILLISADLSEIMEISDSLIVMYEGKFVAWFPDAAQASEKELGQYMLGIKKMDEEAIRGCEN